MKKKINKVRWAIVNLLSYSISRNKNKLKDLEKSVFIDISHNVYDRYLYLFLLFFEISNFKIYIRNRYSFLGSWASNYIFKNIKNIELVNSFKPSSTLKITDKPADIELFDFLISPDYFSNPIETSGYYFPMPMVDSFYVHGLYKNLAHNSIKKRDLPIFFAGRINSTQYNKKEIKESFDKLNRFQLFQLISAEFQEDVLIPGSSGELEKTAKPITIVDRDKTNISPSQLPYYLNRSDFFLAFPGVVMPFSHNIIEAMANGCIPILEHPELFHPKLEHSKNCIAFNSASSFITAINLALNKNEKEIAQMRSNVLDYYDTFLSPESAIQNLIMAKENKKLLFLIAEYQSVLRMTKYKTSK